MKKYSVIFCFLLATVFVGVPSFFAFAGEQGISGRPCLLMTYTLFGMMPSSFFFDCG